ncbi:MAG: 3-methyl-2-oxobutanoate hydroxymethyltransferase, partial [Candidatus Geothermarchaeales archaeon]
MDKVTVESIRAAKGQRKIAMVTAYDYPTGLLADQAGMDIVLVGDSLGMVVLGYDTTVPVTMDEMVHHCRAVSRGVEKALLVGDMPFMSFHITPERAVENAGRLVKEGGCKAVKIEGGANFSAVTAAIVNAGIPVMAHVGLLPASASLWSGYRLQGKTVEDAEVLLREAQALETAG